MLIRYHAEPSASCSQREIIGIPSMTVHPSASIRAVCAVRLNISGEWISAALPRMELLRTVIGTRIVLL